jgi:hypothetical protein
VNVPPGTHTIPSTGGAVGPVKVVPLTRSGYLLDDAHARERARPRAGHHDAAACA